MDGMTSDDCCYYGARGTHAVATSAHSSDELSDISRLLLLAPIVGTGDMTLGDRCYYWAHGTRVVATGAHSSDRPYDIR
jgi:hypothetical protein